LPGAVSRTLTRRPAWRRIGHLEVIAAALTAVREGKIRRLIINLPPRHLKSLMASIAFPAWCLGHDPSAQILCVSYAQELADKLARDCRGIMMSPWYRQLFPTRLAPHRQAVQEFIPPAKATGSPPRPVVCSPVAAPTSS
jgi:hypothetical protein